MIADVLMTITLWIGVGHEFQRPLSSPWNAMHCEVCGRPYAWKERWGQYDRQVWALRARKPVGAQ